MEEMNNLPILSQYQKTYFLKLINFLNINNKYYSSLFSKLNINLNEEPIDILCKLPVSFKEDIRNNYENYISNNQQMEYIEFTTGTSGLPLQCPKTRHEIMISSLEIWKARKEWDPKVKTGDLFVLYGSKARELADFFDFTVDNIKRCFKILERISPRWLCGPITAFEQYGKMIESGKVINNLHSLKFIELQGEYADSNKRKYIESIFQCKTINHYGTRETWAIAYECKNKNMHILDKLIIPEVININIIEDFGLGGEILLTSLYNTMMPIIRYNTQDVGMISHERCQCNQISPTIELISGRSLNFIKGTKIMGDLFFKRLISHISHGNHNIIAGFKAEQVSRFYLKLLIKPGNDFNNSIKFKIYDFIRQNLGNDFIIKIEIIKQVPVSRNGKSEIFRCLF